MADVLLEVEDRAQPLERVESPPGQLTVADADQSSPLGSEQWLDHDVASELIEGGQGFRRRLSGPGRRDRQPRRPEQGQGQILIDGRFHRSGRIEDRYSTRRDSMKGVQPEDDLLQAAGRHHSHEHAISFEHVVPPGDDRGTTPVHADRGRDRGKRDGLKPDVEPIRLRDGGLRRASPIPIPGQSRTSWTRRANVLEPGMIRVSSSRSIIERAGQDTGVNLAERLDAPCLDILEHDLGRAEQQGVHRVEVVIVACEDGGERIAVIA